MENEFQIRFEENARIVAEFRGMTIPADQKIENGGRGEAPEPMTLFLASIGTCAGFYVRSFCETRGIDTDGIRLTQRLLGDPVNPGRIGTVQIDISLPNGFPEKYKGAIVRAAETCAVKRYIQNPFAIETRVVEG
jgi:ribosomal protein S12 methylthiotransferase accessory factor